MALSYSSYGYCKKTIGLLGFNGERSDRMVGVYLLGNGYRVFNTVLMRFHSPDSMSPFAAGGLNSYAYCLGDPVNFHDPNGHSRFTKMLSRARRRLGEMFNFSRPSSGPKRAADIAPKEFTAIPEGYELIGYHGGALEDKSSLENGLDIEKSNFGFMGEGFYVAHKFGLAVEYAGNATEKGLTPHVYGVYAKNFKNFVNGQGYLSSLGEMKVEQVLYKNVIVREQIRLPIVRRDSYTKYEDWNKQVALWRRGEGA